MSVPAVQGAKPRIVIFDSGVGGLSIVQSMAMYLPGFELIYVADNARFPYGDLAESEVIGRCRTLVSALVDKHSADLVVIACNTASTVVLPTLRAELAVPVVGVVPAIKPAAALSQTHRIALLATPATVRRAYLDTLIAEFASHCEVFRLGSSELVRIAEASLTGEAPSEAAVQAIVRPLAGTGVDAVVLGCTHFPLIREVLRSALPEVVHWVDSGDAIARRVTTLWAELCAHAREDHQRSTTVDVPPLAHVYFTAALPEGVPDFLGACGWPRLHPVPNWQPESDG